MIQGTDLSHWNDRVDYAAMRAAGIRFAMLKIGQGNLPPDEMFQAHKVGCESMGVAWGAYWFADYRLTGAANATQFMDIAHGSYGQCLPALDLEFYDGFGPHPDGWHMLKFALDFFGVFERKDALLYTNRDVLNQMRSAATGDMLKRLVQHPLWIASGCHYPIPDPFPTWILNQHKLDGVADWAHGSIDLDEFNGDDAAFQTWLGSLAAPVPMPVPIPLTLEQRVIALEAQAKAHGWTL
jgi:GH25 family lysozyme M1 (1,4-beta-N-acetylmuramidase)